MVRSTSRRFGIVAVAVAGVMLLSGCDLASYLPGTPRPSWCDPTDTAVNDGHTAEFTFAYTTPKGPLSQSNCQQVANDIQQAADFASQYPTVGSLPATWHQATVYTPGQGFHYADFNRLYGPFDPTRPNYLMYNGTAPTANLVGMMFLVDTGGDPCGTPPTCGPTTTKPPAGFPGANDHWHNHGVLCVRNSDGVVIGESMSDSTCTGFGGTNHPELQSEWMVHVWLPVYAGWQATDIFNVSHPSV